MIEEAFTLVCRAAFTLREVADITRAARLKVLETSSMSAVKPRVIRGLAAEAFMKASDLADALGDFDAAVSFADLAMTTVESLADFGRDRAEAEFLGSAAGNAGWSRLRRNGPDDVASARKILNCWRSAKVAFCDQRKSRSQERVRPELVTLAAALLGGVGGGGGEGLVFA